MPIAAESRRYERAGVGIILLGALLAIVPFLVRGPSCGADFLFHFSSWHSAAASWRQGVLYPHWMPLANFGAGEARFVFYPPLTWMLGAALGLVLPWSLVPIAMSFILLLGTGLATRALARQSLSNSAATLAGCFAMFSGFTLYELYFHGDFAAVTGGFWIPLLLLFLFRGARVGTSFSENLLTRNTLALALVVAGAWLSNAPVGVMATYLLVAVALTLSMLENSWTPMLRAVVALLLGYGLCCFYLVPAAVEQHWVDIQKLFAAPDHLIQNRWLTTELASPEHSVGVRKRLRGAIEAGMLLLASAGIAVAWLRGKRPLKTEAERRQWWIVFALVPCAVLFLMLPVSLPVWNILPRLRYLQYPWRWLVVLQAPMAILVAGGVWPRRAKLRLPVATASALLFLAVFGFVASGAKATKTMFQACDAAPATTSLPQMSRALAPDGIGMGGAEEYASPIGARNDLIPTGLPDGCLVRDPQAVLSTVPATNTLGWYTPTAWSPALGTCDATFTANTNRFTEHLQMQTTLDHSGYMVLRLRSFPSWRVRVNGQIETNLPQRADGLIVVPVTAGPLDLTADWKTTKDVVLGRALSVTALILLAALWFAGRTKRPRAETQAP